MEDFIGYKGVNSQGLSFEVIMLAEEVEKKSNRKLFVVEFEATKYKTVARKYTILQGLIKDRYHRSVLGIGYLGDISGVRKKYRREYIIWTRMLRYCYNQNDPHYYLYGGKGYTVESHWHCFKNFVDEVKLIDGYDEVKFRNGDLELDKDLKQIGIKKKVYALETCTFLDRNFHDEITNLIWRMEGV